MKNTNLQAVLELAKPVIAKMIENFKKWHLVKWEKEATQFDIEMYELGITGDLMGAFGRYILNTDIVTVSSIHSDKGVLAIRADVIRDDQQHYIETEVIVAGGYNIQCEHFRYIVKTKLPVHVNNPIAAWYKEEAKRRKGVKGVEEDMARNEASFQRRIADLDKLAALTYEDVIKKNHLEHEWEDLNEHAQKYYESKERFDVIMKAKREQEWAGHQARTSPRAYNYIRKDYEKTKLRLEKKMSKYKSQD